MHHGQYKQRLFEPWKATFLWLTLESKERQILPEIPLSMISKFFIFENLAALLLHILIYNLYYKALKLP